MIKLQKYLDEAFHTYEVYLNITDSFSGDVKLSLLKWPDIASSAMAYAQALENKRVSQAKQH